MKFHPDVLRAHAEFGGDLESMQRLYDSYDQAATITALRDRVAEVERERDEARLLVTEANNSLYGSQSYFHSRNGGPFDKYHLAREIDRLKSELGELTESLKYAENDFIKACNLAAAAEARATAAEAAIARLRDEGGYLLALLDEAATKLENCRYSEQPMAEKIRSTLRALQESDPAKESDNDR